MTSAERRMKIYELLIENGSVQVNDLAGRFDVTTMTIRRDLAIFEKQGVVATNYGGAILNKGTAIEPSFSMKSGQMVQAKQRMGQLAAGLIQNGDSIFIDCGTTTMNIAKYLANLKLTVVTNSLAVCNIVKSFPKIKLICVMGTYDETSDGFLGGLAIESISQFNLDKAFIGTQGFDIERGATVPDETDAKVKECIVRCAKARILMSDHEKIGLKYFARFASLEDLEYFVTDQPISEKYMKVFAEKGIQVLITENAGLEQ